jgi:hypothetical protein
VLDYNNSLHRCISSAAIADEITLAPLAGGSADVVNHHFC